MTQVTVELPDEAFAALRLDPDGMARAMRWAVAVYHYHRAAVSQEVAAQIAGMTRLEFLDALARAKLDTVVVDLSDLRGELLDV